MAATVTSEQVPSPWHRRLERLVFVVPAFLGVAYVSFAFVDPAVAVTGVLLFLVAGSFVYTVLLALAVYLDAGAVAAAELDWQPNRTLYGVGAFLFPIVALHYLYVRYRHVRPASVSDRWWYLVPISTGLLLLLPAAATLLPGPGIGLIPVAGLVLLVFPVAVYRDATYLRSVESGWQPDPATHFLLAVFATVFSLAQPLYALYYVVRRWRSVGLG